MAKAVRLDPYLLDVLMRDLVRHDRAPSAFLVYLWLWGRTRGRARFGASLQDIARGTGLSKSSVQNALKRLKRRHLVSATRRAPTVAPILTVHEPWKRLTPRAKPRAARPGIPGA